MSELASKANDLSSDKSQKKANFDAVKGDSGLSSPTMRHALSNTARLTPDVVMQLQRTIGNQAVQRLLDQNNSLREISQAPTQEIQRYSVSAGDAGALAEEKFASADEGTGIKFTTFTSCIGVIGRKNGKIVGAHLVRVGTDEKPPDVDSVISALDGIEDGMMFGFLGNWEGDIKQGIAAGLDIYDWRPKEQASGWHVKWEKGSWVLEPA